MPTLELAPAPELAPVSDESKFAALETASRAAIGRWHDGEPPPSCDGDFEVFQATVINEAWPRLARFRHGGKKTLPEFAYLACYHALRDIQRQAARDRRNPTPPKEHWE